MGIYDDLVTQSQMSYERHYGTYAAGGTPYELSRKEPLPYDGQIARFAQAVREADCVLIGGASGLSAAGGGDFYYGDTPSFRRHFGKFADRYGIKGAFDGSFRKWDTIGEKWAFLATFLDTTLNAPVREPYRDLDAILEGKDFFALTTNQDTQFSKLYPADKVAAIQGDHRFFQCSRCCCDDTWDAVESVQEMVEAMGEGTSIPESLVPRCPRCGAEAFPWVRGYGNFLQGSRYREEYGKASRYIEHNADRNLLLVELGVGRMTPMFIQEPFWRLTYSLPHAFYIGVNDAYAFLPRQIEDKGMAVKGDIAQVLKGVRALLEDE